MRVLLTYDPTAKEDGLDVRRLISSFEAAGHAVDAQSLDEDGWKSAVEGNVELVAVAGGDGAVGEVLTRLGGSDQPALLFPFGSANNVATSLGYRADVSPADLIARVDGLERARFDLPTLSAAGDGRRFVESAGVGVFGEMLLRAGTADVGGGDATIELGLRLLHEIADGVPARACRVVADGVDLSGEFIAVEALNVGLVGPNVPLAPEADPGDGLLELTLLCEEDRLKLAAYAAARLHGRPVDSLDLDVRPARRIELYAPTNWPLHVDDEVLEGSSDRQTITVEPGPVVLRPPA
jgi:diacylglycerol kinase family enzyme